MYPMSDGREEPCDDDDDDDDDEEEEEEEERGKNRRKRQWMPDPKILLMPIICQEIHE